MIQVKRKLHCYDDILQNPSDEIRVLQFPLCCNENANDDSLITRLSELNGS